MVKQQKIGGSYVQEITVWVYVV